MRESGQVHESVPHSTYASNRPAVIAAAQTTSDMNARRRAVDVGAPDPLRTENVPPDQHHGEDPTATNKSFIRKNTDEPLRTASAANGRPGHRVDHQADPHEAKEVTHRPSGIRPPMPSRRRSNTAAAPTSRPSPMYGASGPGEGPQRVGFPDPDRHRCVLQPLNHRGLSVSSIVSGRSDGSPFGPWSFSLFEERPERPERIIPFPDPPSRGIASYCLQSLGSSGPP